MKACKETELYLDVLLVQAVTTSSFFVQIVRQQIAHRVNKKATLQDDRCSFVCRRPHGPESGNCAIEGSLYSIVLVASMVLAGVEQRCSHIASPLLCFACLGILLPN